MGLKISTIQISIFYTYLSHTKFNMRLVKQYMYSMNLNVFWSTKVGTKMSEVKKKNIKPLNSR